MLGCAGRGRVCGVWNDKGGRGEVLMGVVWFGRMGSGYV